MSIRWTTAVALAVLGTLTSTTQAASLSPAKQRGWPKVTIAQAKREIMYQMPDGQIRECVQESRRRVLCRVDIPYAAGEYLENVETGELTTTNEEQVLVPLYATVWPKVIQWRVAD